ncbi:MAG: SPOR domain-containing protein [Candidatus Rokubacteria bacterium]|nr:SPOR domain-containing protein [Candidatus Rokubacteria bacterium]
MTRMVDEDRPGDEPETEAYEDEAPRSIFSAIWFRVIVVVVVLGVVTAVAVPYVLDWVSPTPGKPPSSTTLVTPAPPAPPTSMTPPAAPPTPRAAVESAPAGAAKAMTARPAPAAPGKAAPVPAPAEPGEKATKAPPTRAEPSRRAAKATKSAVTKVPAGSGTYWVQVGAFRDAPTAERVAERLRAQKYTVEQSMSGGARAAEASSPKPSTSPRSPGSDLYDVFVSGGSPAALSAKLGAKGLAAEPMGDGAVVKPSLPLRDAVALSKDLAAEGLKVQVKRSGSAAPSTGGAATPTPAPASSAEGLHRVRVGPYADRAAATAALRELEAAGFKPYIAREGR